MNEIKKLYLSQKPSCLQFCVSANSIFSYSYSIPDPHKRAANHNVCLYDRKELGHVPTVPM